MKKLLKFLKEIVGIPESLVTVSTLVILAWGKIKDYDYFVSTKLSYLIATLLVTFLLALLLPRVTKTGRISFLGYKAPIFWERLKACIRTYHSTSSDLERRTCKYRISKNTWSFERTRNPLQNSLFTELSEQRPGATNYSGVVVNNFKQCFAASSLQNWTTVCKRNLDSELDGFDNLAYLIKKASYSAKNQ